MFADPLNRIRSKQTARIPILIGNMQDDGSLFTLGETNLSSFLTTTLGPTGASLPLALIRSLYPGLNDTEVISSIFKDLVFQW